MDVEEKLMSARTKADVIRDCFAAYRTNDRKLIEGLLAEDFTFTSPYDDRIDRTAYFERCWPNSRRIRTHDLEQIFVEGDQAFVRYRCLTVEGKEFRNTEFFTFAGEKVCKVEVYFGATYAGGAFIRHR